jgi:hypothetical protein
MSTDTDRIRMLNDQLRRDLAAMRVSDKAGARINR